MLVFSVIFVSDFFIHERSFSISRNFILPLFMATYPPFWCTFPYIHFWKGLHFLKKVEGKESLPMPLTCQKDVRDLF